MITSSSRPRSARILAALTAVLVAFGGALTASTAALAADAPTLTVTAADRAGGTVTVTGSGFSPESPGIYLGLGPAGLSGFYAGSTQLISSETIHIAVGNENGSTGMGRTAAMTEAGAFSVTVTVPAWSEETPSYALYTSKAHGQGFSDPSQDVIKVIEYEPTPPGDGDGDGDEDGDEDGDDGSDAGSDAPRIEVVESSGLNPEGDTVTVRGYNFLPDGTATNGTRPPLSGQFGGAYVVFGKFPEVWKPSEVSASSARPVAKIDDVVQQRWAVLPENAAALGAQAVAVDENGDFEITLQVQTGYEDEPETGTYGIYTYPGSGATYTPFELSQTIAFAEAPAGPQLTVTPGAELAAEGGTVEISGTGFAGENFYLQVGWVDPASWAPSTGGVNNVDRAGVSDYAKVIGSAVYAHFPLNDGAFGPVELTIEKSALDAVKAAQTGLSADAIPAVFTVTSGGASNAANETYLPLTFAETEDPGTGGPGGDDEEEQPGTANPTVGGSLSWGIKASFRQYLLGIAGGSITTSGGASYSGSAFAFKQTGSSYSTETERGTVSYGGTVRMTGHGGLLDYQLSNFRVRFNGSDTATILVDFVNRAPGMGEPSRNNVALASVNLNSGSTIVKDGVVRILNASSTGLAGANQVFGQYAGEAFDPVSITIGANQAADGGTVTVGNPQQAGWVPPSTPPADSGLEFTEGDPSELAPGEQISVTGGGFAPNEQGIHAVLYSEPIVLASDLTADAEGVVSWTGTLPAGVVGEHTLTLQGVDHAVGLPITILPQAAVTSAAVGCIVDSASLNWGFKESFRSYLTGAAAGEWTTAGGAGYTTPEFEWTAGTGSIDIDRLMGELAFSGSVTFTGHDGALNTTIANPVIRFNGDSAELLLDIEGTTQQGEQIVEQGVVFAALEVSVEQLQQQGPGYLLEAIPAMLTEAGSAAFGTYPAGSDLDAITIAFSPAADCGALAEGGQDDPGAVDEAGNGGMIWLWIGLAVLVALLILAAVLIARRRAAAAQH